MDASVFTCAWGPTPTRRGSTRGARSPQPQALFRCAAAYTLPVQAPMAALPAAVGVQLGERIRGPRLAANRHQNATAAR